jgi:hypothetical protein
MRPRTVKSGVLLGQLAEAEDVGRAGVSFEHFGGLPPDRMAGRVTAQRQYTRKTLGASASKS